MRKAIVIVGEHKEEPTGFVILSFHNPEFFDLSVYFLTYCTYPEAQALLAEWKSFTYTFFDDKQKKTLNDLSMIVY